MNQKDTIRLLKEEIITLKNYNGWLDNHRKSLERAEKAEAERDEALAQVAAAEHHFFLMAGPLQDYLLEGRPRGQIHCKYCGGCHGIASKIHKDDCVLVPPNLPAAAKEMAANEFQRGVDVCRKNIASSFSDVLRVGSLQTFMDDDIQEVNKKIRAMFLENARLREALKPFAAIYISHLNPEFDNNALWSGAIGQITPGNLRKAQAALSPEKP